VVETLSRRRRPPNRIPIYVRLGDGWWADAFAAELQQQADTAVEGRRFRFILGPAEQPLPEAVAQHRARGVILRSPADPAVVGHVEALVRRDVPVVTVGSDLPAPNRTGYAGANLIHAGDLVASRLLASAATVQTVLMVSPGGWFYADQEIEQGLRRTLRRAGMRLVTVTVRGQDHPSMFRSRLETAVAAEPTIGALFTLTVGAGEALAVLRAADRSIAWAGAWGPTPEHLTLLREGVLDLVADVPVTAEATAALQMLAPPGLGDC
jgi:LacI family transcriptional regulator